MSTQEEKPKKELHSASDIIELLNFCEDEKQLSEFFDDVDKLFKGDPKFKLYSKFEQEVIFEHFFKKLNSFYNPNKTEVT